MRKKQLQKRAYDLHSSSVFFRKKRISVKTLAAVVTTLRNPMCVMSTRF